MANVKNVERLIGVLKWFEKKEDGVYEIKFKYISDDVVHKMVGIVEGEAYFSNIITSNSDEVSGNITWLEFDAIKIDDKTMKIVDIYFDGVSLIHQDDYLLNAFKSKGGAC